MRRSGTCSSGSVVLLRPRRLRPLLAALVAVACAISSSPARADDVLAPGVASLLDCEQKLLNRELDGNRIHLTTNKQDPRYAPETGARFIVKSYWMPADEMHAHAGAGLSPALRARFHRERDGKREVLLLVHPESEAFYGDRLDPARRGEDFVASATSSSRTVVAWPAGHPEEALFAKLSLAKEIGHVVRTIPGSEVARSIGVNDLLAADAATLPESFHYLPEVLGVIPKGMDRGGMILRAIPPEIAAGARRYVPLFSLYADREGKPPIVVEMIQKSGMSPEAFVAQRIMKPFLRQWWAIVLDHHLVPEPHAQNVLIELGDDGLPTGHFLHRDLGGFRVSLARRAARGLPQPKLPLVNDLARDYKEGEYLSNIDSSIYTYFLGGFVHNLDRKLPAWSERYALGLFRKGALEQGAMDLVRETYVAQTGKRAIGLRMLGDLRTVVAREARTKEPLAPTTRPATVPRSAVPSAARRTPVVKRPAVKQRRGR